jgi:FkbM family methyltransferase
MAAGKFEPTETELMRTLLAEADLLVNVGANIGYYCCHALSMKKSVIAFEPIYRNLRYLCRNVRINGWTDCEIFPIALSNHVGILEMYGSDTGASAIKGWAGIPESHVSLAPCSTLDLVLGSRLNGRKTLILADVEGAEQAMLEGAAGILANVPKPVWLLEICFTEHHPDRLNAGFAGVFQLFWDLGYESFSVGDGMRPVTSIDVRRWTESKKRDFGSVNFLFREAT